MWGCCHAASVALGQVLGLLGHRNVLPALQGRTRLAQVSTALLLDKILPLANVIWDGALC